VPLTPVKPLSSLNNSNINDPSPAAVLDENASKRIHEVLLGEEQYNYHGTYVASLIAYKNEKIELVLIQIELSKSEAISMSKLECFSQAELDKLAKLYSDPEVVRAYQNTPLSPLEKNIDELFVKYNIDFMNKQQLPMKIYHREERNHWNLGRNCASYVLSTLKILTRFSKARENKIEIESLLLNLHA
jgi:hypothetical protein